MIDINKFRVTRQQGHPNTGTGELLKYSSSARRILIRFASGLQQLWLCCSTINLRGHYNSCNSEWFKESHSLNAGISRRPFVVGEGKSDGIISRPQALMLFPPPLSARIYLQDLVRAGARVNLENVLGWTALMFARYTRASFVIFLFFHFIFLSPLSLRFTQCKRPLWSYHTLAEARSKRGACGGRWIVGVDVGFRCWTRGGFVDGHVCRCTQRRFSLININQTRW